MKRLFLAAVFAVGAIATTQAQQTACCSDNQWLDMYVHIEPILCLELQCDPDGWVNYDCPSDFASSQTFLQGPGDPNFGFLVWSNVEWDISIHSLYTHFVKPNALGNAIPSDRLEFRVGSSIGVNDATIQTTYIDVPYGPGTLADHTSGNVIQSADPALAFFNLNFRLKPLANAWNYTPGNHWMPVHVTLTAD